MKAHSYEQPSSVMSVGSSPSLDLPLVIIPKRFTDARGWFSETFHQRRFSDLGIACTFIQDNQSSSTQAGTIRGFHYQRPPAAQAKLVGVDRGRVLDVAVDIRRGSPTFGKYVSIELSAERGELFYVPVGFAHGFVTLEDNVLVTYRVSSYYAPSLEAGIIWNDPKIAFPWPFTEAKIIKSDKDARLPHLKESESPFPYDGHSLAELRVSDLR